VDRERLQQHIGYRFSRPELLSRALTHRSHGALHNERLEFLGDAILNCVVAAELFERFAGLSEGELSRLRAHLVREESLHQVAQTLGLGDTLQLGEGELKSGGFARPSILADAFEALIGAVFVDGGFSAARDAIRRLYEPLLEGLDPKALGKDPKTLLQELLQAKKSRCPSIPWWQPTGGAQPGFRGRVPDSPASVRTTGNGSSRRNAEQERPCTRSSRSAVERAYRDDPEPFRCGAIALIGRPNVAVHLDECVVGAPIRAIAPQRNGSGVVTVRPFDGGSARTRAGRFLLGVPPAASVAVVRTESWESGTRPRNPGCAPPVGCHHGILGQRDFFRLEQFLQKRLRILSERLRIQALEQRLVQAADGIPGRRKTAVDKDRAYQRFERIGQNGGPRESTALQFALPSAGCRPARASAPPDATTPRAPDARAAATILPRKARRSARTAPPRRRSSEWRRPGTPASRCEARRDCGA